MKKYLQYIARGVAVLAGVLLFVYLAAYIYVSINKKDILRQLKQEVTDHLNGDVQIDDVSLGFFSTFPHVSVLLEKVLIKDTLFPQHHYPFLESEKVYINLDITGIITKGNPVSGIKIEKGQLFVYTDTLGYTNSYLFSPKENLKPVTKKSTPKIGIDNIKLRDVRLILDNRQKGKLYDFDVSKLNCNLSTKDSILRLKINNDVLIHSLAFNNKRGSFLKAARFKGNYDIYFDKIQKQLKFDEIDVTIKDHPFTLSGAFNFTETPTFSLTVVTKNINYDFARNLLPDSNSRRLAVVGLEKPIDEVRAEISGTLKGAYPLVNAKWKCNKNNVQSKFANFTNCSFTGRYTNELVVGLPRKNANSRLQLSNFKGDWENLTINSKNIYIDNLTFPMVKADIKTDFDLTQLNTLLGSSTMDLHQGKGLLDINYDGPLQANSNKNTLINGKLTFSDGVLAYHPRDIEFKNVNGNIVFKNTDVYVNDFRGNVQGNKIVMNGSGKNMLALMKTNPGKLFLDWNIYSPSLNLSNFTSLLKKRGTTVRKKNLNSNIGDNLDRIVNQANFHLDLKTDELKFKRFTATNVKASIGLINEDWLLKNVSLNQGGGSMIISGSLNEKNNRQYQANIKANIQNVDVNKVFYAFNNFGQNGISSENLKGKLTSLVDVKMDLDRNLSETPKNMAGIIEFSLKNGALLHYKPLMKVGELAFPKRNFNEILFAELKDRFDIKDREIFINRMAIESTVLTLFVEGVYSLRGKTDISIQLPLNNLKKRGEDYKLENKGANAKGGTSLYVRGTPGDDGNMKFKLDLFRKFRKKNNKKFENNKQDSNKKDK